MTFDRQLLVSAPLPLARVYERAHNQQTPHARHRLAYLLGECYLRLGASIVVSRYLRTGRANESFAGSLRSLMKPSVGTFMALLRDMGKHVASDPNLAGGLAAYVTAFTARTGEESFVAAVRALSAGRDGRTKVSMMDLLEKLIAHRNKELGHGAQRGTEYYDDSGGAIMAALGKALGNPRLDPGRGALCYVHAVRTDSSGARLAERWDLVGINPHRIGEVPAPSDLLPERVYVWPEGEDPLSLDPLVIFTGHRERGDVCFLNKLDKKKAHYLDYGTGEQHTRDLDDEARALVDLLTGKSEPGRRSSSGTLAALDAGVRQSLTDSGSEVSRRVAPSAMPAAVREAAGRAENQIANRYIPVDLLGEGGMGAVHRAWDTTHGHYVALKTLTMRGESARKRFEREARALASLDHPGIVRVLDHGVSPGAYMAMELIEGRSLHDLWREGVAPAQAASIVAQAARALQHAHDRGVVHRDVKPQNVMVDATGHTWIVDFGLAKSEEFSKMTKTGATMGTIPYMSPEQASGRSKEVGPTSDVYSLGATLYHALCGVPPFDGDASFEVMNRVIKEPPTPPRKLEPGVPAALEAICLRCLEKDPAERYASAGVLADDLEGFAADPGRPAAPTRSRAPLAIGAVAVGLLAIVGGIAAFGGGPRGGPSVDPSDVVDAGDDPPPVDPDDPPPAVPPASPPKTARAPDSVRLNGGFFEVLDADGELLGQGALTEEGGDYRARDAAIGDVDGDGVAEVVVVGHHATQRPGILVLAKANGEVLTRVWNPGWIYAVAVHDGDGDGASEIYAGCVVNTTQMSTVFSLDGRQRKGWGSGARRWVRPLEPNPNGSDPGTSLDVVDGHLQYRTRRGRMTRLSFDGVVLERNVTRGIRVVLDAPPQRSLQITPYRFAPQRGSLALAKELPASSDVLRALDPGKYSLQFVLDDVEFFVPVEVGDGVVELKVARPPADVPGFRWVSHYDASGVDRSFYMSDEVTFVRAVRFVELVLEHNFVGWKQRTLEGREALVTSDLFRSYTHLWLPLDPRLPQVDVTDNNGKRFPHYQPLFQPVVGKRLRFQPIADRVGNIDPGRLSKLPAVGVNRGSFVNMCGDESVGFYPSPYKLAARKALPTWLMSLPTAEQFRVAATGGGVFPFVDRVGPAEGWTPHRVRAIPDLKMPEDVSAYGIRGLLGGAPREFLAYSGRAGEAKRVPVARWTGSGLACGPSEVHESQPALDIGGRFVLTRP